MARNRERTAKVYGALIAGGRGVRLGMGPKYAVKLGGRSLLAHIRARIAPQVAKLALNINDAVPDDAGDLVILKDLDPSRGGPLMGVLTALEWAAKDGAHYLLTVPTDTPFLPADLASRLLEAGGGGVAFAASAGQGHYICALWPLTTLDSLRTLVLESNVRRVDHMLDALDAAQIEYQNTPFDAFFNINTPADLERAEALLKTMPG